MNTHPESSPANPRLARVLRYSAALFLLAALQVHADEQSQIDILSTGTPQQKEQACQELKRIGTAKSVPALLALAKAGETSVRIAAVNAIAELGDASAIIVVANCATDPSPELRKAAETALATMHRGDISAALAAAIPDARPKPRSAILKALGVRGDNSAILRLQALAMTCTDTILPEVLSALAQCGGAEQLADIMAIVTDADAEEIRNAAADALATICQRLAAKRIAFDAAPLAKAMWDGKADGRIAMLRVGGAIVDPGVREALRKSSGDADGRIQAAAIAAMFTSKDVELLPDLLKLATESKDAATREKALFAVVTLAENNRQLHPAETLEALKKCDEILAAGDQSEAARQLAAKVKALLKK